MKFFKISCSKKLTESPFWHSRLLLNLDALNSWSYWIFEWKSVVSWNKYDKVIFFYWWYWFSIFGITNIWTFNFQFWEFLSHFENSPLFSLLIIDKDKKDLNAPFVRTISKDDLQERVFATQVKKDTILFAYTSHAKLMKGILSHLSLAFLYQRSILPLLRNSQYSKSSTIYGDW